MSLDLTNFQKADEVVANAQELVDSAKQLFDAIEERNR